MPYSTLTIGVTLKSWLAVVKIIENGAAR